MKLTRSLFTSPQRGEVGMGALGAHIRVRAPVIPEAGPPHPDRASAIRPLPAGRGDNRAFPFAAAFIDTRLSRALPSGGREGKIAQKNGLRRHYNEPH